MRVRHTGPAGGDQRVEVTYVQRGASRPQDPRPPGPQDRHRPRRRAGVLALASSRRCARTCRPRRRRRWTTPSRCRWSTRTSSSATGRRSRSWACSACRRPGCGTRRFNLDLPVSLGAYKHPNEPRRAHRPAPVEVGVQAGPADPRAAPRRPAWSCSPRRSRSSSGTSANSSAARSAAAASTPRATSSASPSTAGRTATPTSTTRSSDDFWVNGGEQPCVVARQAFGRITIANSDAAAYAYTDAAIDHGAPRGAGTRLQASGQAVTHAPHPRARSADRPRPARHRRHRQRQRRAAGGRLRPGDAAAVAAGVARVLRARGHRRARAVEALPG